jgi:hypothetical protein
MLGQNGTQVTTQHIMAADMLRQAADASRYGFSRARDDGMPITAVNYRPMPGPSIRSIAQAKAARVFQRAMAMFPCPGQQRLIQAVLLDNNTLAAWCASEEERRGHTVNRQIEMGRLLGVLDALAAHFETDIDQALDRGVMLPL